MSDPGALAAKILQQFFPLFGTFRRHVTYQSFPQATYNATTGLVTKGTPVTKGLYVIFSQKGGKTIYRQNDDVSNLDIEIEVIFPSLDLGAIVPKVGDVMMEGLVRWVVTEVGNDPKPVHYALICKAM